IGYAYDGQNFHLGVPEHMMDLWNVPAAHRGFYSFVHDPAHIIELAGKDGRNQRGIGLKIGVQWIQNIVSKITRVDDSILNLNDRLRSMKIDLQNTETLPVSWPKFNACASEIMQTSTYQGRGLTTNQHPPISASTKECFAMSDIWSRQDVNPPPSFSDLVASSQRVGLTQPGVTLEDMESQYRMFARQVLMESAALLKTFPDVANLLAASVTRTSSESVTESMGSMLKTILREERPLDLIVNDKNFS
ncbi:unnamed protein product, partial [Allacma fusca]